MLRTIFFAAMLLAACRVPAQVPLETRHTVLTMGKPAGTQLATQSAAGVREYAFEFNDRGRGPKLTSRVQLDEQGIPLSLEVSGNDYLKAPVSERYSLHDGRAQWRNHAESGERKLVAPAFYVAMNGVPEEAALLASALLKTPHGRLALLPEGEASIRRTAVVTLRAGATVRDVTAYEISGLGFTPSTVWLDDDNSLFASVDSWSAVVREGWEASVPQLLERQSTLQQQRTLELARALTRKPAGPLVITGANLFDAATGTSLPGMTVVIDGPRIKSIGKDGAVALPRGAESIDAQGRALLPGLWDMHVHLGEDEGIRHLAAGVTSVRDLANEDESLQAIKRRIEAGAEIGPRIVMRGLLDGRGPYTAPTELFVDSEAEARSAIESYAQRGYEGVKIYSSLKPQLVPYIIKTAHAAGLRVSGHVPAFMTAQQVVEAGIDELQHINFLFLNFFFDAVQDTRTPARFTAVAERAATLDLDSPRVRAFIRLLKERGVVIDPTVALFQSMFTSRAGTISPGYAAIAHRLPPQVRRELLAGGLPVPEGMDARYRESARALLRMVKLLHEAGVTLVPGTDDMPGFTLHRELELYVEAGIPAAQVLKLATLGAARVAGRERDLGSIEAGKLADLLLVAGDPARHISDIRQGVLVVKNGHLFEPAALYRALGVQP